MTSPVVLFVALSFTYFLYKLVTRTDVPKIKNLPEIPGVPLFGNLLQLGTEHARVSQKWAEKYGPVYQTRLGNRVRKFRSWWKASVRELTTSTARRVRKHF